MSETLKPTAIADVALPVRLVTLKHLKTHAGEPVNVLCGKLTRLEFSEIVGKLPGLSEKPESGEKDIEQQFMRYRALVERVIEAGCALLGPDGREQRPAFYFTRHIAGALDGRYLEADEVMLLGNTCLELGGYLGGAADKGSFPARHAEGAGDRERAVDGLQGVEVLAG